MKKSWLTGLVGAGLVALVLAGCGESSSDRSSSATNGPDESKVPLMRVGTWESLDTINPNTSSATDQLWGLIYPRLVRLAASQDHYEGDLASKWESSDGNKTWTWTIRTGGKWSDGKPITARDVAWTLTASSKYVESGYGGQWSSYGKGIVSATAPDAETVVVKYDRPIAESLMLSNMSILMQMPAHIWSKHVGNNGADALTFPNYPTVTGGPFLLDEFRKFEIAQTTRNENFYGPKPRLQAIGIKNYSNSDAEVAALKSGEIDVATLLAATAVPALRKDPNIVVKIGPGFRADGLGINGRPGQTRHPSLRNQKVRQAINFAIDRQNIVDIAYRGTAKAGAGLFPPDIPPWHNPDVKPVFDPETSRQMLDAEGYKVGSDGIRSGHGERLSYEMLTNTQDTSASRIFQILKTNLKDIGIEIKASGTDFNNALTVVRESDDWDMISIGGTNPPDPDSGLDSITCEGYFKFNCDKPEVTRLVEEQRHAQSQGERVRIVRKLERMNEDDAQVLGLNWQGAVEAYRKGWKGLTLYPDSSLSIYGFATVMNAYHQ